MRERGCGALLYLPDELSPCASVPKFAPSHTCTLACLHAQGLECCKKGMLSQVGTLQEGLSDVCQSKVGGGQQCLCIPCLSKYLLALVGAVRNLPRARGMVRYLMYVDSDLRATTVRTLGTR